MKILSVVKYLLLCVIVIGASFFVTNQMGVFKQTKETKKSTYQSKETSNQSSGTEKASDVYQDSDGNTYYWRYHKGSYEDSAVIAGYQPVAGQINELVQVASSGKEKTILKTDGAKKFIISGNMIFYEKPIGNDQADRTKMMVCRYKSGDKQAYELFEGRLKAKIGDWIICSGNENSSMKSINVKNKEVKQLTGSDTTYLTSHDGFIYYQTGTDSKQNVNLCKMKPDGSDQKDLCNLDGELEVATGAPRVCFMVFRNDDIYFSVGTYGGGGLLYDGGKILKVKQSGSDKTTVAGESGDAQATFQVKSDGSVESKTTDEVDFSIDPMDTYACLDGNVYLFGDDGKQQKVITKDDYQSIGSGLCGKLDGDEEINVKYVEKIGNDVYFLVDHGTKSSEGGMGWRYEYNWDRSAMMKKNLSTGETKTIYKY